MTMPASAMMPVSEGQSGFAQAVRMNNWHVRTKHTNFDIVCFHLFSNVQTSRVLFPFAGSSEKQGTLRKYPYFGKPDLSNHTLCKINIQPNIP